MRHVLKPEATQRNHQNGKTETVATTKTKSQKRNLRNDQHEFSKPGVKEAKRSTKMIETYKGGTLRKLPTTTTLNNFIDFIFDMRISVLKQKQMKQSKIKVK